MESMIMALTPGLAIDHYRIETQVGRGSSGEVWQALDGSRTVAIKFLNARLLEGNETTKYRQRFYDEIIVLEKVGYHPYIPTLYGYNLNHERPYFVMEYADGLSYSDLVRSGELMRVPVLIRLDLLANIAKAVSHIHENGYIHRDIKPANLHGTNHPFLIDFSIAIAKSETQDAERSIGTGMYMPPPDGFPADELTDNFAFALVAYEMLFGQHAIFKSGENGASISEIRAVMRHRIQNDMWNMPTKLSEGELPGSLQRADLDSLDDIFRRALGERRLRYHDLQLFISDLQTAIVAPENEPFLDYVPSVIGNPVDTPDSEDDYTLHEVRNATLETDHNLESRKRRRYRRRLPSYPVILVGMLCFVAFILLIMLITRLLT